MLFWQRPVQSGLAGWAVCSDQDNAYLGNNYLFLLARHRRGRWLNNRVEQDHRQIKRLTRPMLGFQGFWTAKRTLAGIEEIAMLAKGQVRAVPRGDIRAQRSFVQQIFGLTA